MLAVAFDTLKLAQKFEKAGFPIKQAQDMAAAQAEAFAEWQNQQQLATREDIQKLEAVARGDSQKLSFELQKLEAANRADLRQSEERTNTRFAEVNQRIADKAAETVKWVIGASVAQAALIIGILKFHG
jgi:hypothetical protein